MILSWLGVREALSVYPHEVVNRHWQKSQWQPDQNPSPGHPAAAA